MGSEAKIDLYPRIVLSVEPYSTSTTTRSPHNILTKYRNVQFLAIKLVPNEISDGFADVFIALLRLHIRLALGDDSKQQFLLEICTVRMRNI